MNTRHARTVILNGEKHLMELDSPERVAGECLKFFDEAAIDYFDSDEEGTVSKLDIVKTLISTKFRKKKKIIVFSSSTPWIGDHSQSPGDWLWSLPNQSNVNEASIPSHNNILPTLIIERKSVSLQKIILQKHYQ